MNKIMLWMGAACLLLSMGLATAESRIYKVQRVAADDSLNMRTTAGVQGAIVSAIPADGTGVVSTGREQKLGRSTWAEVHWSGKSGWVNKYYLAADTRVLNAANQARQPGQVTQAKQNNQPPPQGADVFMRCGGTEPFWSMHITESQLKVKIMDGAEYSAPVEFRKQSENNTSIAVVAGRNAGKGALSAVFLQKVDMCSDNMSDKNYPYSITAMLDGTRAMSGCCEMSKAR